MRRRSALRGVVGKGRLGPVVATVAAAGALSACLGGVALAGEAFECGLAESGGVPEADARTAASLVCDKLRRGSGGRGVFEIRLAALGRVVFVTAMRREPADSVTVRVDAIEEMAIAAERIARALVRGEPFPSTQRVGNLLASETQPALSKKGSLKLLVGVVDVESPGHGARAAGFSIGILYSAPRFALPAEMRFAWDDASYPEPELGLFSLSVGGRGYLSTRNVTPFVGGGLGILKVSAREGEYPGYGTPTRSAADYFDAERSGVAPYLEVGVEALRLHRARVALHVRVDLPTGSLRSPELPVYSYGDDWETGPVVESVQPAQSRYIAPVSIGVTVAF